MSLHQFSKSGYNYEQLCLYNRNRNTFITSSLVRFPVGPINSLEDFDTVLLDFSEAASGTSFDKSTFYSLEIDIQREFTPKPIAVCCIGYPSYRNFIDYDGLNYAAAPNAVWGEEAVPGLSGRLSFKPINPIDYDPTGMSGGPVFAIYERNGHLTAYLAGILTEATRHHFNFMSLMRVKHLFDPV
ncbi:MAG: hypothetical protein MUC82_11575 [Cypionkella sp.]|jgi:hypothetical protein|nr:hypothetical protein [Cypionkella sp.]